MFFLTKLKSFFTSVDSKIEEKINNPTALLLKQGWTRILVPPLVSNERIWMHPKWKVQLESKAIEIIKAETTCNAKYGSL